MSARSTSRPDAAEPRRIETDVVIAGGGPVGLALAVELGTRGVDCVVIEPRTGVSRRAPRAKTTSIRTMEHMRRWGVAQRVREAALLPDDWPAEAVYCTSLTGHQLRRFSNVFGMNLVADAAETGLQIPQPLVEEVLREVVSGLPSVRLLIGERVTGVEQDPESVRVVTTGEEGQTGGASVVLAKYLAGCDGGASTVRRALGVETTGEVFPSAYFNVVFRSRKLMELATARHGRAVHYWVVNPKLNGMIGAMDGRELFFGGFEGMTAEATAADVISGLEQLIGTSVDIEIVTTDAWRPRISVAESFVVGRVFLAGDAAHANPPWGGHGFNTGVGDAVNLGWKLAAVLQGWGGAKLLDSYDAERRPAALRTVEDAAENMKALDHALIADEVLGDDADARSAREALAIEIARVKESEFYSRGLVLGYHYADSPVVIGDGMSPPAPDPVHYTPTTAPGARLPHVWLEGDRVSIYDRLGSRFTVVVVGDALRPAARQALVSCDVPVVQVAVGQAVGFDRPQVLLVRPDQHIAWRGTSEVDDLIPILHRVSGGQAPAPVGA